QSTKMLLCIALLVFFSLTSGNPTPSISSLCAASAHEDGPSKWLVCCERLLQYPEQAAMDGLCYPLQAMSGLRCELIKPTANLKRACCDFNPDLEFVKTPTAGKVCPEFPSSSGDRRT